MEKIKLTSGVEFELITNGIMVDDWDFTATFLPGAYDLTTLYEIFNDHTLTSRIILLSAGDDPVSIYSGYTGLSTIGLNQGEEVTVTVSLRKPDEKEARLESLEAQMTDAQEALCDIYELIIG